jgi:hypothetical protein
MDKSKTPSKRSFVGSSNPSKIGGSRMLVANTADRLSELQALTNKMNEAQSIKRSTAPPPVTKPSITPINPILNSPFLKKNDVAIESKKEIKSTPIIAKVDNQTLPKPPTKQIEKLSRNYDEEIKILHNENEALKIQLKISISSKTSNDDVEYLTNDIAEMLNSNESLSKELEESKEKLKKITSKLKSAETEISETMLGVEALHEENSLLEKKIKQSNKEDNVFKIKLQESNEKNQSLIIELETIKSKLQISEEFSNTNINQINNYIKDMEILKNENTSIYFKINEATQELEATKLKLSTAKEELSAKNINSIVDNDKIISDNKYLKEKNLLLLNQLEIKTEELLVSKFSSEEIMSEPIRQDSALINQNADLLIQLEKLKEELEMKTSKLNSPEKEKLETIKSKLQISEEFSNTNTNQINNYIKDIQILKSENEKLTKLSVSYDGKNHSLLTELALTSKDLIQIKSNLKEKEKEIFELNSQLNDKINNSANDNSVKIETNEPSKSLSSGIQEDISCDSNILKEANSAEDISTSNDNEIDLNNENDNKNIDLIKDDIDITFSMPTSTNKVLVHKFAR